jgi:uncharacterized protein (DUF58 family)
VIPAEFLKKVRAIELAVRKLVLEGMSGQYRSAFRGSGVAFREFRPYVYGDDVRHIAWNVSARSNEPVIKIFEEERERTLFMVVDVSSSLRKGPWAQKKAERLAEVAATLALSAAVSNDKMGLLLYSDRVEKVIPPAKGRTHLLRLIRDVLAFEPVGTRTNPAIALKQLDKVLKKHSIVFLLSDMEVLPDEKTLRQTGALHEFIAIGVEHPREHDLPDLGFIEMQTAEYGRPVTVDTSSESFRRYLKEHGEKQKNTVKDLFRRSGVDLLWIRTDEDYVPVLQNFFRRRSGLRSRSLPR